MVLSQQFKTVVERRVRISLFKNPQELRIPSVRVGKTVRAEKGNRLYWDSPELEISDRSLRSLASHTLSAGRGLRDSLGDTSRREGAE